MFDPFSWLRAKTKAAVLNGLADAFSEIADAGSEPDALEQLRLRLALPAPAEQQDEPEPQRRRAKNVG